MANTTKIGIAGEYALVSELIKRGFVACITDKNTPKFDNGTFDRVFYCYVRLGDNGNTYQFIKARDAAECIHKGHLGWLNDPKAKRQRKDSPMRMINPRKDFPHLSENNFDDLGL